VTVNPDSASDQVDPADIPDFIGPWADDFRQAYLEADEYGREILRDGVITEREYLDLVAKMDECFIARGYEVERFADGRLELTDTRGRGEQMPISEDAGVCAGIGHGIDQLYLDLQRNPDNTDWNELMAACLAKGGLVDQSFTKEEYVAALEAPLPPWAVDDPVFQDCLSDPLGLVSGSN